MGKTMTKAQRDEAVREMQAIAVLYVSLAQLDEALEGKRPIEQSPQYPKLIAIRRSIEALEAFKCEDDHA